MAVLIRGECKGPGGGCIWPPRGEARAQRRLQQHRGPYSGVFGAYGLSAVSVGVRMSAGERVSGRCLWDCGSQGMD